MAILRVSCANNRMIPGACSCTIKYVQGGKGTKTINGALFLRHTTCMVLDTTCSNKTQIVCLQWYVFREEALFLLACFYYLFTFQWNIKKKCWHHLVLLPVWERVHIMGGYAWIKYRMTLGKESRKGRIRSFRPNITTRCVLSIKLILLDDANNNEDEQHSFDMMF